MVEFQTEQFMDDFAQRMQMQGLSLEQYFSMTGMDADKYKEQMRPRALQSIQTRLTMEAVAKAEGIEATEEDLEAEITRMAEMYRMEVDKVKELVGDNQKEEMKKDILIQKAIDLVAEAAVEA